MFIFLKNYIFSKMIVVETELHIKLITAQLKKKSSIYFIKWQNEWKCHIIMVLSKKKKISVLLLLRNVIHNTSWETLWGMEEQQKPSCWQMNRVPSLTQNAQQQEGCFQLGIATLVQGENNQISSLWYTSLYKLWMCLKLDKVLLSVICAHTYTHTHTLSDMGW